MINYVFMCFSAVQIYVIHIIICRGNDVTTFESRDKIPWCYNWNETSQGVLYGWYYSFIYLHNFRNFVKYLHWPWFIGVKRFSGCNWNKCYRMKNCNSSKFNIVIQLNNILFFFALCVSACLPFLAFVLACRLLNFLAYISFPKAQTSFWSFSKSSILW